MTGALAASGTSTLAAGAEAGRAAAVEAAAGLQGRRADLALVFVSAEHAGRADRVAAAVAEVLEPAALAGCSTEGAIGDGRELERRSGVSVLAASLPGAQVRADPLSTTAGPEGAVLNVPSTFEPPDPGAGVALVLADPFSFPVEGFLRLLGGEWGGALAVGGLASGGRAPGEHALICGRQVHRGGAVVVTVAGGAELHAIVSQGCAPIGPEMVVTSAQGHVIDELAGKPAYEQLVDVIEDLDHEQREMASTGVMAGLVIDENRADYGPGDYLIRGLVGADRDRGTLVVAGEPRVGQTLRFHIRDAESADRDLRRALRAEQQVAPGRIVGGVLFACNGRGTAMFAVPDHDAATVEDELAVPTAGMFCAGEIGPVGGVSFVHGFTATMALLVERSGGS
jgi:small ligand-binding sensory domain FIST